MNIDLTEDELETISCWFWCYEGEGQTRKVDIALHKKIEEAEKKAHEEKKIKDLVDRL